MKLQFVLGTGLASKLIAWYGTGTGGYSHVDAILSDGFLLGARSDSIGGQPPGVRIRPPGYERWDRQTIVDLGHTDKDAAWEQFLLGQVGKPYDKGSILGFILGRSMHQANHWICSALQYDALLMVGLAAQTPFKPSTVTPDGLLFAVTACMGGSYRTV